MSSDLPISPELEEIDGKIQDIFRALQNGFQKLDNIKDSNRQSKQLEELTGKMRECKRLIKEYDQELKNQENQNPPEVNKKLNEKKQTMIKELNSYVALRKTYQSSLGNKRVELFDMGAGTSDPVAEDNIKMASDHGLLLSCGEPPVVSWVGQVFQLHFTSWHLHGSEMSNQELIYAGRQQMDETDQAIERSKMVVEQTIEVGTQTAANLKGQTEQMGRIANELDTIQFSIKKASQLVKEIGRQVATDKCIMLFLFLIVCGVIAVIIVKIVRPNNKSIPDIPGLAPPAPTGRKLLSA
ncbi:novel plant SNARE 13-like isoform X1 [Zingiber officinale]|uniref:novel plant SNARE 13-like isoform X1 n=1 Tax=Zingiber officinale TaxID=94328 RepID=UPI001C4B3E2A|nr:novel plant SNARE 13-like isoform X1 [Zingiber officinale]XP_042432880.1 novel plant SNARE 13-like isoform X1 [Zingiber officinale]